ncbi:hypothetical protein KP509_08G022200 [Ceratopteris richardii]|uniref:Pentatricopeptide repeat-containing protein n=1 Tax=Ceratopteris richardii TaxID=49495 RepID=A0A8T2U5B7_CERRI|nr:hypothetical protein KP509_08G022200 [Ceratopteris richardii]
MDLYTFISCNSSPSFALNFTLHSVSWKIVNDYALTCSISEIFHLNVGVLQGELMVGSEKTQLNVDVWIKRGHCQLGDYDKVIDLFHKMLQQNLIPDPITFLNVLSACKSIGSS